MSKKEPVEKTVRDIRRKTRRHRSSAEKIRSCCRGCAARRASQRCAAATRDALSLVSCSKFRNNEVRLQLHALAYNLCTFMRTLALPKDGR